MDETPDQPVDDAPASGEASRPFAPQPTLALDHMPPINVEVGSGAHGGPAPPRVARQPGPLEAGGLRIVIVAWCFWLLGSWAMSWVAETSSVLRMFQYGASVPVVRWMLLSGMLGMMVVWPAFRLGQPVHPREPGRGALQAFLDWLAMVLVFQAVVWSLQVIAGWTLARGLWLDAAVVSWTLLTALIVGWGRTVASGLVRTTAMALCLAVVLAEPVLGWLQGTDLGTGAMRWSPLETVWVLTNLPERASVSPWSERIIVVGVSAVLGWGVLAVWGWVTRAKRPIARTLEDDPYGQLVAVVDIAAGQREPGASDRMDRPPDPRNGD